MSIMPTSLGQAASGATHAASALGPSPTFMKYGLAMRFVVKVDALNLGLWASCEGLRVDLKTERVADGGHYGYTKTLPVGVEYANITLTRAMDPDGSRAIRQWLTQAVSQWVNASDSGDPYQGSTAQITLQDVNGHDVTQWTFHDVYPISWVGPQLSGKQNEIALEKLTFEHSGFLQGS